MVVLSVFALGAVTMNPNLIDWIDNHWDIIRNSVFNYDMNKFKNHVTTEINSLGIFSMTLNAIIFVSLVCITNFLKFKNIIFALTPPLNLIFSSLSLGFMIIGFYTYLHAYYTAISLWACVLIVILGICFLGVGIFGYIGIKKMKKKWMQLHILLLSICVIGLIISCVAIFKMSGRVIEHFDKHWNEINQDLTEQGYTIRKSYVVNELQINLKLTGFFIICFAIFSVVTLFMSIYQYLHFKTIVVYGHEEGKISPNNMENQSRDISGDLI